MLLKNQPFLFKEKQQQQQEKSTQSLTLDIK